MGLTWGQFASFVPFAAGPAITDTLGCLNVLAAKQSGCRKICILQCVTCACEQAFLPEQLVCMPIATMMMCKRGRTSELRCFDCFGKQNGCCLRLHTG